MAIRALVFNMDVIITDTAKHHFRGMPCLKVAIAALLKDWNDMT